MKTIFALLALLVSDIISAASEPVTYPYTERNFMRREVSGTVLGWILNDTTELLLSTNVMRETRTIYYYPAAPYTMLVIITDYYRTEEGNDELFATNQFQIYVRAIGRGGRIIGYTNIVEIDESKYAPGGNYTGGSTTSSGMRITYANSTTYAIDNRKDEGRGYQTEFTFLSNYGMVTLRGPKVAAGELVTYTPSFAQATTKLGKNVNSLGLVTVTYNVPLND